MAWPPYGKWPREASVQSPQRRYGGLGVAASMDTLTFVIALSAALYLLALVTGLATLVVAVAMVLDTGWRQLWASTRPR